MKKILIVEDEPDIMEVVRIALARNPYQIELASTGEEALEKTAKNTPDLVLLDIMLPGISGLEVCRQLKSNPKTQDIHIIILTAKAQRRDIRAGYEAGCDDYIVKPFNTIALIEKVKHILGD